MNELNWQEGLKDFQIAGVEFLTTTDPKEPYLHKFLFDEPGLGKTPQTIRAADKLGIRRILVIGPAISVLNWQSEFGVFQKLDRNVGVVSTSKAPLPNAETLIVSHDLIRTEEIRQKLFAQEHFDLIIIDEAHKFCNRETQRTCSLYGGIYQGKNVQGLITLSKRVWILTGTPMPNHAGELYSHFRALAPHRLITEGEGRLTHSQFLHRFCVVDTKYYGGKAVNKVLGNKNVSELKERLKGLYLRRRTVDVLKELPPLRWGTIVLKPPRNFNRLIDELEDDGEIQAVKAVLAAASMAENNGDSKLADSILAKANLSSISKLRRIIGEAKVDPICEFITEELENNPGKILLFAYHREVIAKLEAKLKQFNPVVILGGTPAATRKKIIDNFQENDTESAPRIFIGQITSTNSVITLTSSNNIIILEPSWTPAENIQAAGRAWRIGQTAESVLARFVTLAGSLDEHITRIIQRKTKAIAEIIL